MTGWRWHPWMEAGALLVACLGLGRAGLSYVLSPQAASLRNDMLLDGIAAVSNARTAIGGFHLGLALVAGACLLRRRWRIAGFAFLATVIGVALAVRLASLALDGPDARILPVLAAEALTWVLLLLGLFAARRERRAA